MPPLGHTISRRGSSPQSKSPDGVLAYYSILPGSRSEPRLPFPDNSLASQIKRRLSNTLSINTLGKNLAPWNPLKRTITEQQQEEDTSPISHQNNLARRTTSDEMFNPVIHQAGHGGGDSMQTVPIKSNRRGLFGSQRPGGAPANEIQKDNLDDFGQVGLDDHNDDASIFTTEPSGLRRKESQRKETNNIGKHSGYTSPPHGHSTPLPANTPSTGSRIAQFFGGGRDKSANRQKVQRPSTSDGNPGPPLTKSNPRMEQGMHVRVEPDSGSMMYDQGKETFIPRPSDVSFDPTMEVHQIREIRANNHLQPTANGRIRTASGPTTPQQLIDSHPLPTKTTNRPFGFGTKPRQASNIGVGADSRNRSTTQQMRIPASGGQDWPRTRAERNFKFTWEANPGIVDGKELMGFGGEFGRKRVKVDTRSDGAYDQRGVTEVKRLPYVMGYERSVLDCEAMIHEAYTQVCSGKATWYPDNIPPPKRILDLGTGVGLWPISMARQWPESKVVGFDVAPVQTDLAALARAQALVGKPESSPDTPEPVDWEDLARRVTWKIGNFLDGLPFETDSFDFVHLRFVGLGIPETAWESLLDECARVLKPNTGILEIIEMSKVLPAKTPPALRASFSSLMLSSFLQPYPFVTLRPALISSGLITKEAMNVTFRRSQLTEWHPASTIEQCLAAWVDSAVGKGKHGRGRGMSGSGQGLRWGELILGERALRELESSGEDELDKAETALSSTHESKHDPGQEKDEMTIVAWIVRKQG